MICISITLSQSIIVTDIELAVITRSWLTTYDTLDGRSW